MPELVVDEYPYQGLKPTWDHSIILPPLLEQLRSLPPQATIFDLGCGNGAMLAEVAKHGNWRLSGVETSPSGVEIARGRGFDVRNIDPATPLASIFGEASFDLVISIEVIEHVYDPRFFLRQAKSLLKPGGTLLVSTPYHGYLKNLLIALAGKTDQHMNPLWDGGHIKFWSRRTLEALFAESGFEELSFTGAGRLPFLWKSMVLSGKRK